jgi:DNA recombination-dependent growth factor C
MDKFLQWIENNQEHIALTDKSHKNVSTRKNEAPLKEDENTELATYGDAVLKLALCQILWQEEMRFFLKNTGSLFIRIFYIDCILLVKALYLWLSVSLNRTVLST